MLPEASAFGGKTEVAFKVAPDAMDVIGIILRVVVFDDEGFSLNDIVVPAVGFSFTPPTHANVIHAGFLDGLHAVADDLCGHGGQIFAKKLAEEATKEFMDLHRSLELTSGAGEEVDRRAACRAGTKPAMIPTMIQIPMASNILKVEMKTGKFKALVSIWVRINTSASPMVPPMIHKKEDSNRNSVRIILLLAPIAFLSPI